jgi:predicted secreted protein
MGCMTEESSFDYRVETRDFSLNHSFQTGYEVHQSSYTMGIEDVTPGVKRQKREADNSSTSIAKVKNGGPGLFDDTNR